MTKTDVFLVCLAAAIGMLFMAGSIWLFSELLGMTQRVLMFSLGLLTNAAISIYVVWKVNENQAVARVSRTPYRSKG